MTSEDASSLSTALPTTIEGCALRPWRESDKPALLRHADNRKVWRNLTDLFPHPYTDLDADDWLRLAQAPGDSVHFAITWQDEAIGGAGLIGSCDIERYTANFGYWLGEAWWGRGIATACARALKDYAFAHTPFVRLEARVFAWNPASMRVLEKAGFVREGVHRLSVCKDGQLIDSVCYAACREI